MNKKNLTVDCVKSTLLMVALFIPITFVFSANTADAQKRIQSKAGMHNSRKGKFTARRLSRHRDSDRKSERTVTIKRNGKIYQLSEDKDLARFDQPEEAQQWYLKKRLPKGEKVLPVERYFTAKQKIKKMRQFSTARGKVLLSQEESGTNFSEGGKTMNGDGLAMDAASVGSTGGVLGTWKALGPGNVGGRTRALLVDPLNTNIMYAGAVDGGIWKSTDAGASWNALDDFMANIAVTTLAFDPTNSNTIYAGTGEGFFNADGVRGAGIFKSTDAGATWIRLSFTADNADFYYVNDLVVSPGNAQHLYAATRTGVLRSLDGGANWTMVLASGTTTASTTGVRGAMDLVIRTDSVGLANDYVFAAMGSAFAVGDPQSRIFRNIDAGGSGTWTEVYTEANMARTSLALAPSNQNVIYAMSASLENGNYNTALLGVFRSVSSGASGSWTTQVRNTSANKQDTLMLSNSVNAVLTQCGFGVSQFINQGWYDNQLVVDPTDENVVWAAGIDVWRSDNGGVNWGVASYWWFQGNGTPPNNGDPQLVHADNHNIVFDPNYNGTTNQTMFVGDDGGVYKTTNAKSGNVGYVNGTTPSGGTVTASSPICGNEFTPGGFFTVPSPVIWGPLNNGYQVTQFNQGLPYPDGATYFGGTQDNGTIRGTDATGANAWARINGGDGGYVAVNPTNTNILYAETTGLSLVKSTNGGTSFVAARSGISGDTFPFYTVHLMDPTNPNRLWMGGRFMWRTDNSAGAWTRTSNAQQTGGSITAIAVAPTDSNIVINGAASGQLRRTTTANSLNSASVLNTVWMQSFTPRGNGNGAISWLAYDPTDASKVYATISTFNGTPNANGTSTGHVFKSADGGATWTNIDGTGVNAIPDIPVHSIIVDPNNTQRLYIGTDLGVFVTLDGGQNWLKETTGFSNVVTESLSVLNNGGITSLFAFTHGRGAFKVTIPASCASLSPTTQQFYSPGALGTVGVTTGAAGCDWNAVSNSSFITVNSGASGAGTGTVGFTVAPNTGATARTGTLTIAGAIVTINQDAAPHANDDSAITNEDTPVDISVLGNDSDPDGDTIGVSTVTQGSHGAVVINGDGTLKYSPTANYNGADSFTYTISDTHGGVATATVSINVTAINDNPTVMNDSATVAEDSGANTIDVQSNDSSAPDTGETLIITAVTQGTNGAVAITGGGTAVSYTPNANYNGADSFNYTISDGNGGVASATVSVNITAVNDNPTIAGGSISRQQAAGASNSMIATVNDVDNSANTLTVTATLLSGSGVTVTGIAVDASGNVTALVAANCGASNSSFTLTVSDSGNLMATALLNVTVTQETTPPVINPISNVSAAPNPNAALTVVNFPLPTASDNCGSVMVTTNPVSGSGFPLGTTTVMVTATDSVGNQAFSSFTVTVGFNFTGFFSPISNTGLNSNKSGSTIPINFSLGGYYGLNIFAPGSPSYQQINCTTGQLIGTAVPIDSSGKSGLSYEALSAQYQINWKSDKSLAGTCRQLQVKLTDGSTHTAAFQFK